MTVLQYIKAIETHYGKNYTAEQRVALGEWAEKWKYIDLAEVFEGLKARLPVETGWIPGRPLMNEVCAGIVAAKKAHEKALAGPVGKVLVDAEKPSEEERMAAAEELERILRRLMVPGKR